MVSLCSCFYAFCLAQLDQSEQIMTNLSITSWMEPKQVGLVQCTIKRFSRAGFLHAELTRSLRMLQTLCYSYL